MTLFVYCRSKNQRIFKHSRLKNTIQSKLNLITKAHADAENGRFSPGHLRDLRKRDNMIEKAA